MFGYYYTRLTDRDNNIDISLPLAEIVTHIKTCILRDAVRLVESPNHNLVTFTEIDTNVPCDDRELFVRTILESKVFVVDTNRVFGETQGSSPLLVEVTVRSTDNGEFVEIEYHHFLNDRPGNHESYMNPDQYQRKVRSAIHLINASFAMSPVTLKSQLSEYINKWFNNSYQRKGK